jgi:hypothetical protein
VAVDGLDAIGKLRGGLPDLIISDLNMPRMSGSEFLDIVRKRFPEVPVIVISAHAANELPGGVAPDAFFHKNGQRFEQLVETVSELNRTLPLRSVPPQIDHKPAQAKWDGDGHYIIGCDECLRSFRISRTTDAVRNDKWTPCVHCGRVVRFFIADGDFPAPAHP